MSSCRLGKNRELKPCIETPTEGDNHHSPLKRGGAEPGAGREVASRGQLRVNPSGAPKDVRAASCLELGLKAFIPSYFSSCLCFLLYLEFWLWLFLFNVLKDLGGEKNSSQ